MLYEQTNLSLVYYIQGCSYGYTFKTKVDSLYVWVSKLILKLIPAPKITQHGPKSAKRLQIGSNKNKKKGLYFHNQS